MAAKQELEVYRRDDGRYDWRLKVGDDIVATSGNQGYENRGEAEQMGVRVVSGHYSGAANKVVRS